MINASKCSASNIRIIEAVKKKKRFLSLTVCPDGELNPEVLLQPLAQHPLLKILCFIKHVPHLQIVPLSRA